MREIEFDGTDIDEALKKASDELDITVDNVEFEIVTLGSKGLFGLVGNKPAVIKVLVKDSKAPLAIHKASVTKKDKKPAAPKKKWPRKETKQKKAKEPKKISTIEKKEQSESVRKIEDFVLYIINKLDENAKISAYTKKNKVIITIKSEKSGKIIGKGGRIIGSIEYLATKHARKVFGEKIRVTLRIEG
jgi:spoIIIJ-associated protein